MGICVNGVRCKKYKTCPHCSQARQNRIGYALNKMTEGKEYLYSLTLTLSLSTGLSRKEKIAELLAYFKKLRKRDCWAFVGGVRALEEGSEGLLHLHILAEAETVINTQAITEAWASLGGYSFVSPVADSKHRRNLCFYFNSTKQLAPDIARVFAQETKYKRMVNLFGSWQGTPLLPRGQKILVASDQLTFEM